ncbi:FAS1-like dehydratase domain-containing protein [Cupriavidus consociatus]|uniref:FAS1-like dehydratase domain-containing protein n=1 Tax=Cupriavidus consociatus TaxID=2821357 RepID=UPI001FD83EB9|nr:MULTISPECIES: MaoC family dehydratase N-terminal domain-containing protein [unclassified Cupriavidus]MDK2657840.1 MaoC family dehydratase N-terminal domain-containing protein [Cupriavidus sp. LEh21]
MTKTEIETWKGWIGRKETSTDSVTAGPVARLAAVLDRDEGNLAAGSAVPPLSHWLFFLPSAPQCEIGPDGHPARGGFLPPVSLPRRMWAGSRIEFHRPICVGRDIERTSTIMEVQGKEGRSGPLVFVKVRHTVTDRYGPVVTEDQDIVYRGAERSGAATNVASTAPKPSPKAAEWWRRVVPDGVLLFRFSALTFNGHRIHYDRGYAQAEEGYPGLVIHGPLQAMLLLDMFSQEFPARTVKSYAFTSRRPLFDDAPFELCGARQPGGEVLLWIEDQHGQTVMEATAHVE